LQSLKTILIQNKNNVTSFTSPAIITPLDRIFLKNRFISLKNFKKFANNIISSKVNLTLFECLTLIYLKSIKNIKKIDYHLIEAGCGFNKDSTNLFEMPRAQIITNLNVQHKKLLKAKNINDICKIKCGALSKKTTIYIGKQKPETLKIIKKILKKNPSKIFYYGRDFNIKKINNSYIYTDKKGKLKLKNIKIYSSGLIENLAIAIKVARDFKINNRTILKAVTKIKLLGRLQFIKKGNLRKFLFKKEDLLLDGCHSEEGILNHKKFIKNINKPKYAIWSLQKNRDPEKYVRHLKCFKKIVAIKIPEEPNSCSAIQLKRIAKNNGIECVTATNITSGIKTLSSKEPKILSIIGSLYTAGKVLNLN